MGSFDFDETWTMSITKLFHCVLTASERVTSECVCVCCENLHFLEKGAGDGASCLIDMDGWDKC